MTMINRAARTKTIGLKPKRDHRDRLEWDRAGRCKYRVLKPYFTYVRVPEFDAPRAAADWVPDWVET